MASKLAFIATNSSRVQYINKVMTELNNLLPELYEAWIDEDYNATIERALEINKITKTIINQIKDE